MVPRIYKSLMVHKQLLPCREQIFEVFRTRE